MPAWTGSRRVAVIPAIPIGAGNTTVGNVPADFQAQVSRRIFYDPAPVSNLDRSLRKYLFSASYGRAWLDADVLPPVTVTWEHPGPDPDPSVGADVGKTMGNAIAASQPLVADYPYVMVVFPPGIPNIRSWAFWGAGQATSYMFLDNPLGAWAMELLHMVTEFGDLYGPPPGRPLTPGNLDEMDTAGAMHPSTFTKLRMGWLDSGSVRVVDPQQGMSEAILHPLALLQPAPDGRVTALKIPFSDRANHYLLVEAREWLDEYDRNTPGLAEGIPTEGLAVYDVDEAVWPPLWLKAQGLQAGRAYEDAAQNLRIDVLARIAGGGFSVRVKSLTAAEDPQCAGLRARIQDLARQIQDLTDSLTGDPRTDAAIKRAIGRLKSQLTKAQATATQLGCKP